jgi:hypothetical protein
MVTVLQCSGGNCAMGVMCVMGSVVYDVWGVRDHFERDSCAT